MRVLLMPHRAAPLSVGGVERWTWTLSEALAGLGVRVQILGRDDRDDGAIPPFTLVEGPPPGRSAWTPPPGVEAAWIRHRHRDARCARDAWSDPRLRAPLEAALDRFHPDVVHVAHVDGWGTLPFGLARRRGLVLGTTLHDYKAICARGQLLPERGPPCAGPEQERCVRCVGDQLRRGPASAALGRIAPQAVHRLLARRRPALAAAPDPGPVARRRWRARQRALLAALSCCDVLTAPSEHVAQVHREAGLRGEVTVIRNAAQGIPPSPEPRAPGPLRVGFFGTSVPSKGLDDLLEAVARCEGRVTLDVHGPAAGGPAGGVRWHGPYPAGEAVARMSRVDLVALPSRWPENAPLVAAEARLARRALLVSSVGGLPEGVRDGIDGWVLPPGDPGGWARCLGELAMNLGAVLRAGEDGPLPPTPRQMATRYLRLWEGAMGGNRSRGSRSPVGAP